MVSTASGSGARARCDAEGTATAVHGEIGETVNAGTDGSFGSPGSEREHMQEEFVVGAVDAEMAGAGEHDHDDVEVVIGMGDDARSGIEVDEVDVEVVGGFEAPVDAVAVRARAEDPVECDDRRRRGRRVLSVHDFSPRVGVGLRTRRSARTAMSPAQILSAPASAARC